jgi:aarF domain-containing kinase
MSERNAQTLADGLCRMRGAALKLGQMISMQEESILPPPVQAALERVRAGADAMPEWQLEEAMDKALGSGWRSKVAEFDTEPMAAASIGQVHRAVLTPELGGHTVAIKVQYPGVADSIQSDIANLGRLLSMTGAIPKGLFLDHAMDVASRELAEECDYRLEAEHQRAFRRMLHDPEAGICVPMVIDELSSQSALTTTLAPGVALDQVAALPQEARDAVATRLMRVTLYQLFSSGATQRRMQTDPNWGNFLYDQHSDILTLIDFGAAREYPIGFASSYCDLVWATATNDRERLVELATELGFLTGYETQEVLEASVDAGLIVGEPFRPGTGIFDFSQSKMTARLLDHAEVLAFGSLAPPPEDSYSLHRVLSGTFLACIKLKARVPAHALLHEAYTEHRRLIGKPPPSPLQPQDRA